MRSILSFLLAVSVAWPLHAAQISPAHLRCDNRTAPLGIDSTAPRFSWKLDASDPQSRGLVQTAYQVMVATDSGLVWDSGKVTSDAVNQVVYAGPALASSGKYLWKVRVWDAADAASPWSATESFTMGLLAPGDWTAQWITPSTAATDVKATRLRKEFTVNAGLARAIIHVTGLGQCGTTINGARAAPDHLTPGWTKYNKTVLYDTYDITALLQPGANAIGLTLGNGMYNIPGGTGRYAKWTGSSGPRKAIAQIRLEYTNGTTQTVITDNTWKWRDGPITFNTVYGGEDFDARLDQAGWDSASFNASAWTAVSTTTGPGGVLRGTSHAAPPLKTFETFAASPAIVGNAASKVYDFGQNALQLPTLTVYGPAGATVKLSPSELGNTTGNGSISPLVGPTYLTYTLKGSTAGAPEIYTPAFFSFGYRYLKVEITGGATVTALTSTVVHTASEAVGDFTCSKELFNRTRTLIRWAQRSNLVSVITDCPHREKLGWLEQYYLHGPSMRYEFDLQALYGKTYTDMADSQRANGLVPDIAPEYVVFSGGFVDSPEWGGAFVLSPAQQYEFYNDRSAIEENYANIKRYVDYLTTKASGNILNHGLGDWYDLGPGALGPSQLTPIAVTATATYYSVSKTVAEMAIMLGNTADAATYTNRAANIRTAFNNSFYNAATGSYSTGSQTANSMPLVLGLVEEANRAKVVAALVADIRGRGDSLTAGDIGHRYLLRALADSGRSDVIYNIHSKTSTPGYGFILDTGATALTEGWNGSASQNHFMLGHIMEWFYHDLAGIQAEPASPGFEKIVIKPVIPGDLSFANASYNSIRGPIISHWTLAGTDFTLNVTIPPGSTGRVCVPTFGTPAVVVREGGTVIWENNTPAGTTASLTFAASEPGYLSWNVGSGTYQFTSTIIQPPSGLTATAGSQQVALTWNPASGATGYTVKRSTTAGAGHTEVATNLTATSFTDTGLTNGTKYFYIVTATTPAGDSAPSSEASATPDMIVNAGFEAPRITSYHYNPAGAGWTFSAKSGANGSGISANASDFTNANPPAPEGTQVAVLQGTGSISQAVTGFIPGNRYRVTFAAAQRGSFNSAGQTFRFNLNGTQIATFAPAGSTYADYTATFTANAATQTLAFVGTNSNGGDNTAFIDHVRLLALPPEGDPDNSSVTPASESQLRMSWNDNASDETAYAIERSPAGENLWTVLSTTLPVNTATYLDSGLLPLTSYDYRVRALRTGGPSGYATASGSTPAGVGDGIPGWWRLQYFGNGLSAAGNAAPGADPDFDGYTNLQEFTAGTVPTNAADPAGLVANAGFESPVIATYQYNPAGAGWTFNAQSGANGSGITRNGSAFTGGNPNTPQGVQVAFIQGARTFSQSVTGFQPGTRYRLTFAAAQRVLSSGAGQSWRAIIDGTQIAFYPSSSAGTGYSDLTAEFIATAATHALSFTGTNANGGDNTIFIDRVRLVAQPPLVPLALTITPRSESQLAIAWTDAATDETSYAIERSSGQGVWLSTSLPANSTLYQDSGLSASTAYEYRVRAVGPGGPSAYATASASTPAGVGDGIPGWWRLQHFGNGLSAIGNAASTADPDGDGMNNAVEFLAGTDPVDATSNLRIANIARIGGDVVFNFTSVAGKFYQARKSMDLGFPWQLLHDDIAGTGSLVEVTDSGGASAERAFYRVEVK
ncbi:MAG: family 78 glycoside hydrolase catalytic domain [Verrucomicrobiota bacterium]